MICKHILWIMFLNKLVLICLHTVKLSHVLLCKSNNLAYVVQSIGFQPFCKGIKNCRRLLKIYYVIAIHVMR